MSLNVVEMFSSIEGEGIRAGYLATFIRLAGCNLHCSYCDSRYACEIPDEACQSNPFKNMEISEIVDGAVKFGNKRITITGGEPLIHSEALKLIKALQAEKRIVFEINIETNGSILIYELAKLNPSVITMDWKSYSSEMNDLMCADNLVLLRRQDVLKFVVGDITDLAQMRQVVNDYQPECHIFVSPVFGKIDPKLIVEFLKAFDLQNIRIQLQLHKLIWDPKERGV